MYWCFTINNPNPEGSEEFSPETLVEDWPDVVYAIWQYECGASNTLHIQGYAVFSNKKRLAWLKANCSVTAHWEARKGTHQQAKAYCSKPETRLSGPWTFGEDDEAMGGQGKRNDLLLLKRKIDSGESELAIADSEETFPVWAKYFKVVARYRMLKSMNERKWHTFCHVFWGPPGAGKSRRALEEAGPGAYWLPRPEGQNTVWWDGYEGQEVVVIDEFYGWIMRDKMQRLCDRYPLLVQTKGGSTPFLAKKIIITSNEHPSSWWPKVGLGAMVRRLTGDCGRVEFMALPHDDSLPPDYSGFAPLELLAAPAVPIPAGNRVVGARLPTFLPGSDDIASYFSVRDVLSRVDPHALG